MKKAFVLVFFTSLVISSFIAGKVVLAEDEKTEPKTEEKQAVEKKAASEKLETAGIEVAEYAVCEGVEERQPVGEKTTFTPQVGKVYFWTTIVGAQQPTQIKHVWYYEGKQMADITLNIQYLRHRTWTYKTIMPEWTGNWSVEVLDSNAKVLKKVYFVIGAEPEKKEEIKEETTKEKE